MINLNKNKLNSIFIVFIVILVHLLLLYGLLNLKQNKSSSKYGSLQMVEVSFALSKPPVKKEIVKPEEPKKIKEKILTSKAQKDKPVDIIKKVKKKKKKKIVKKKPKKKKKKIVKKKVVKKPKKIVKRKVEKKVVEKKIVKKEESVDKVIGDGGKSLNQNAKKTNGNSKVGATLGAGFGFALKGQCSSSSDDADDYGDVKVRVIISKTGRAKEVQILNSSGIRRLDRQAKKIARRHIYSPARKNGKAVEGSVVFTIHFVCGNA